MVNGSYERLSTCSAQCSRGASYILRLRCGSNPTAWFGEVLYFLRHRLTDGIECNFAVVAWMAPKIAQEGGHVIDVNTKSHVYIGGGLEQVLNVAPCRVVPMSKVKSVVHMLHDCKLAVGGQNPQHPCQTRQGGKGIHHNVENRQWLKPM